ncbi:unnamed protein product [Cladocopium goreaui]|uniref:Probable phytanoyl-CoA dioxygenase (Phytanic aci d oxidase) (Phytanoyl-CoA alpha-hydroxylase) (PhyH) n=1 Tax=Cladocopium goreaui TaxID=2562237 RepID=A0A9P1BDV6_9DINO|nr:unnamed protein product [Cladocopium goreaui]
MVEDLSQQHRLIGDLFHWPETPEEWEPYWLSDDQLAFYETNGYVTGIPILTEEQCDALCEELEPLFDPKHPGNSLFHEYHSNESDSPDTVLFHALGAWRVTPGFHDILWNPAFLAPASQLLGGAVRFWHDQLFCKPAHHGGVVAWHQDYSYWTRTKPLGHLTCWIGLDPSTKDNGAVHYIPGSHRWDLLPITGLAGDMQAINEVLSPEQRATFEKPAVVELKRGHCSFHHPLMIHGSFENRTAGPRRATVINAMRDGVHSDSPEPLLQGVPPVQPGEKVDGQFFPLLFDPKTVGK